MSESSESGLVLCCLFVDFICFSIHTPNGLAVYQLYQTKQILESLFFKLFYEIKLGFVIQSE